MRIFGPKHTYEDVLEELLEGLENGTITLDDPEEQAAEPSEPATAEPPARKGVGALLALTSFVLGVVATGVAASAFLLTTAQPVPWAFLVACFVACVVSTAVAFWLGTTSVRIPNAPQLPAHNIAPQADERG